jgi:hypothetical protein
MVDKHHVYMLANGRISMVASFFCFAVLTSNMQAGVTTQNVKYLAAGMDDVVRNEK